MMVPPVNPNAVVLTSMVGAAQPNKLQQNQATQTVTRRPATPVDHKQAVRPRDRRHQEAEREGRSGHDLNIKV